jgi:hypothetical protein
VEDCRVVVDIVLGPKLQWWKDCCGGLNMMSTGGMSMHALSGPYDTPVLSFFN